jgi:dihydroorotase (multifunctional complex type)
MVILQLHQAFLREISVSMEAGSPLSGAEEIIDVRDKIILPGGIDTHVHASDPGLDRVGIDFGITTQAAALGGVTTIVDMPFQRPPTTDPESFDVKINSIRPKAYVDYALWATCKEDDLTNIEPLRKKGIVGYKLVMHQSVGGVMPYHHDGFLYDALQEIKKTGLVATIHAENQEMIHHLEKIFKEKGRNDPQVYLDIHPPISELEAIHRVLFLARDLGVRINIAHCSLSQGIDMINQARVEGQSVTVETCIHYLTLDSSIFETKGVQAKIAPALRDGKNVDALWERMREYKIDCVASDHVPYPLEFKKRDIWEAGAGSPGIQTMFPLLIFEGIKKDRINLPQLVRVMSEGPAKMCGLYPKKGSVQIGADADFAIFDLQVEREIKLEEQLGLEWTLYEGMKAVYPDLVLVRGKTVVKGGEMVGARGYGEFCSPSL